MGVLEIVLLVFGGIIFTAGFLLPVQKEEVSEETKTLAKKEIENMVAKEMDSIGGHVDDVLEEAVEYSMEKTERSLERLSNEKIMAVSEYSDTVLQEIHKNHEEVMFLYDMLNDKHTSLKNTVSEVNKTVKEAEETKKEAEEFKKEAEESKKEAEALKAQKEAEESVETSGESVPDTKARNNTSSRKKSRNLKAEEKTDKTTDPGMNISFAASTDDEGRNCNDRILELHKQGKSKVAIARELGLGVGEVKLVIDLYKNV